MMLELNKIYQGDCIEILKTFPDNSVDAIITDPPYGLSFMNKHWDYDVPSIEVWKECLRVLKHGGHLLSFAGTRTYHRMTCNIEDAGFEIRDMISWIYGSGFPKSLNIGKQIDKIQGNKREVLGKGISGEKETHKTYNMAYEEGKTTSLMGGEFEITKGNSEWEGWGTGLKPAVEPIVVARKPLSEKNVALNVLKWGAGGINIDECRVNITNKDKYDLEQRPVSKGSGINTNINLTGRALDLKHGVLNQGRFPANLILDEESAKMLDEQSGISKSSKGLNVVRQELPNIAMSGKNYARFNETEGYNDFGGASRFFYCAKASKEERNFGLENFKDKQAGSTNFSDKGFGEKDGHKHLPTITKNNHPTVKPIALMEYLIKLVSREGAIVLDPFIGSGTTAIACRKLNRNFIGIEKEAEYIKIANERIKSYISQQKLTEVKDVRQL